MTIISRTKELSADGFDLHEFKRKIDERKKFLGLTEMRFHLGAWEPDSVLLS